MAEEPEPPLTDDSRQAQRDTGSCVQLLVRDAVEPSNGVDVAEAGAVIRVEAGCHVSGEAPSFAAVEENG